MQEASMKHVMIVVAVATVVVGVLILVVGNFAAGQAGEPLPPRMRRNAIILMAAGPLSLVSWMLFNGLLEEVGYRSVLGYALAGLVFVGGGFLTGFFSRLRIGRRAPALRAGAQDHPEAAPTKDPAE